MAERTKIRDGRYGTAYEEVDDVIGMKDDEDGSVGERGHDAIRWVAGVAGYC